MFTNPGIVILSPETGTVIAVQDDGTMAVAQGHRIG